MGQPDNCTLKLNDGDGNSQANTSATVQASA